MTDSTGEVVFAQAYDPYGVVTYTAGTSQTDFGFTGEQYGDSTTLLYLRARYYNPNDGRFMSRDTWSGDVNNPLSFNKWMYTEGNPINRIDPSGNISQTDDLTAQVIAADLKIRFNVEIVKDWGYLYTSPTQTFINDLIYENGYDVDLNCGWRNGNWRNLNELELVRDGVELLAAKMGGANKFIAAMKNRPVEIARVKRLLWPFHNNTGLALPEIFGYYEVQGLMLPDSTFNSTDEYAIYTTIHEMGHVWDIRSNLELSLGMAIILGNGRNGDVTGLEYCRSLPNDPIIRFGCAMFWPLGNSEYGYWVYNESIERAPGDAGNQYARVSLAEDWADSVAYTVYPEYGISRGHLPILDIRKNYVGVMMSLIP